MNKVEKIKAEIERRKEIHFKDYHINKNGNSADYGACNVLTQLLTFIDSLEEEPVSEDLEEAACEYDNSHIDDNNLAFKAGAQWQKERMIDKAFKYINYQLNLPSDFEQHFRKAMEK